MAKKGFVCGNVLTDGSVGIDKINKSELEKFICSVVKNGCGNTTVEQPIWESTEEYKCEGRLRYKKFINTNNKYTGNQTEWRRYSQGDNICAPDDLVITIGGTDKNPTVHVTGGEGNITYLWEVLSGCYTISNPNSISPTISCIDGQYCNSGEIKVTASSGSQTKTAVKTINIVCKAPVNTTPNWVDTGIQSCSSSATKYTPSNDTTIQRYSFKEQKDNNKNSNSYNQKKWVRNTAGDSQCAKVGNTDANWVDTENNILCSSNATNYVASNDENIVRYAFKEQVDKNPNSPTFNQKRYIRTVENDNHCTNTIDSSGGQGIVGTTDRPTINPTGGDGTYTYMWSVERGCYTIDNPTSKTPTVRCIEGQTCNSGEIKVVVTSGKYSRTFYKTIEKECIVISPNWEDVPNSPLVCGTEDENGEYMPNPCGIIEYKEVKDTNPNSPTYNLIKLVKTGKICATINDCSDFGFIGDGENTFTEPKKNITINTRGDRHVRILKVSVPIEFEEIFPSIEPNKPDWVTRMNILKSNDGSPTYEVHIRLPENNTGAERSFTFNMHFRCLRYSDCVISCTVIQPVKEEIFEYDLALFGGIIPDGETADSDKIFWNRNTEITSSITLPAAGSSDTIYLKTSKKSENDSNLKFTDVEIIEKPDWLDIFVENQGVDSYMQILTISTESRDCDENTTVTPTPPNSSVDCAELVNNLVIPTSFNRVVTPYLRINGLEQLTNQCGGGINKLEILSQEGIVVYSLDGYQMPLTTGELFNGKHNTPGNENRELAVGAYTLKLTIGEYVREQRLVKFGR